MIRSMTGYGRAREGALTLEVKAVNHRYLDISVRTPRTLMFLEEPIKSAVQKHVARGKVEVILTVDSSLADVVEIKLNRLVMEGYLAAVKMLETEYGLENRLSASDALRLPEVMCLDRKEADQIEMTARTEALAERALAEFNDMRAREGEKLAGDILEKCGIIEDLVDKARQRAPVVQELYKARLEQKIRDVLEERDIDEARVLTEVAIFADKTAIDEELVRLESHFDQLRSMLKKGGAIGRKLDFLIQEFGREANTIGSKGNDVEMSRIVVDMKAEIEKIREQVQNLE